MKALYAYFGLLDLHEVDSPGHFLYQLGLLDSIRLEHRLDKFDFFSYYPKSVREEATLTKKGYPDTELGRVFAKYQNEMIESNDLDLDQVLSRIRSKEYSHLFLKARFRNLSTLAKKWKDALFFEKIIETAILSGYTEDQIIVLDTDLSLPKLFFHKYEDRLTVKIPSIHFKAISDRFLLECADVHINQGYSSREKRAVFYGNINTTNYKSGNSKSEMLNLAIDYFYFKCAYFDNHFTLIGKESDLMSINQRGLTKVDRQDRWAVWHTLESSLIMLNVTKEKYADFEFIPARVFEAMIFGMIPVSYRFEFLSKTFSFETVEDLNEIVQYLNECEPEDLVTAYSKFVSDYLDYSKRKESQT